MNPDKALQHLKSITSPRTHGTLEVIYEVCQEQFRRGVNDFSVSTVARLGYKRGVPKAQSMRNKTGEHYRMLISTFEKHYESVKGVAKKERIKKDWIQEIKDSQLRLQVNIMHSELVKAQKLIKEFIPPNQEIHIYDNSSHSQGEYRLNQLERDALTYISSNEFLKKWSFVRGKNGCVIDESGVRVFPVATEDAILKSLKAL